MKTACLEPPDELVGGVPVQVLEELRPRGDDGREHAQGGAAHLIKGWLMVDLFGRGVDALRDWWSVVEWFMFTHTSNHNNQPSHAARTQASNGFLPSFTFHEVSSSSEPP